MSFLQRHLYDVTFITTLMEITAKLLKIVCFVICGTFLHVMPRFEPHKVGSDFRIYAISISQT